MVYSNPELNYIRITDASIISDLILFKTFLEGKHILSKKIISVNMSWTRVLKEGSLRHWPQKQRYSAKIIVKKLKMDRKIE